MPRKMVNGLALLGLVLLLIGGNAVAAKCVGHGGRGLDEVSGQILISSLLP